MIPPRLCFIGLQLLTLTYTAQSLVMLTATSEDVKELARKFVSESLADKIAEFLAISAGKMTETVSNENDINEVNKDIHLDSVSDAIVINDDFVLRDRGIHETNKPFRTTKDLNTPPVRNILELEVTPQIEPKYWQEETIETSNKITGKRPYARKIIKKFYKQKYRPGKIDHLSDKLGKIDRQIQLEDLKKQRYHPHKAHRDLKEDLINNDNRHLHIGNPESIEEETDDVDQQSTDRKNTKQLYRKPSQPNRDSLKLIKQFPKYKQLRPNPIGDLKQYHISNFKQAHIDNIKDNLSGNLKQDHIDNDKQDFSSNLDKDHVIDSQQDPIFNFHPIDNNNQDHSTDFKHESIDNIKQDHSDFIHDPIDNVQQDHVSKLKKELINNFKQDQIADFKQDLINKFKQDLIDNPKRDHIGGLIQDAIDGTEYKHDLTGKLMPQSTVRSLRMRKELYKPIKNNRPQSQQDKKPLKELKQLHHSGRYKDELKGYRHPQHKLYFPNKPKMPTEEEKSQYEDAKILFKEPKKTKKPHHPNDGKPQSEFEDSLRIVEQYPKHRQIHHLEPKLDKDNKYPKAENEHIENNDNIQSGIITQHLTTKTGSTIDEYTSFLKHTKNYFPNNNYPESEKNNITKAKENTSRGTKSTVYHGAHKVTEETTKKEDDEFNAQTKTLPKLIASNGNLKLPNPKNEKENENLWVQIEKHMYKRPTSK